MRGSKQKSSVDKEGVDLGGWVTMYIYICTVYILYVENVVEPESCQVITEAKSAFLGTGGREKKK